MPSQSTPVTIRAVIFDLDGVVRHWPGDDITAIERQHGLAPGSLFAEAFEPSLLLDAITGRCTDERWRGRVADRITDRHGVDGRAIVDAWARSPATVDATVLDLVRSTRRRCPTVLLTNATTRLPHDLAAIGLTDEFDRVFNSAELGTAKPDHRCFELVLHHLGVGRSSAAFIDDSPLNVDAARTLGLRAHHFVDVARLERFLADLDLGVA